MRVIVEASSLKDASTNYGIDNSAFSQTTVGSERPSDMTVSINGHEVGTVYLPDNPRDIRGTLTLTPGDGKGATAGNYGDLVNRDIPDSVLETLEEELPQRLLRRCAGNRRHPDGRPGKLRCAFLRRCAGGRPVCRFL